jgi:hypothetical protein
MADVSVEQILEIIGVYFSNCYWNTLYKTALEDWQGKVYSKKEDAYRSVIERYSKAFCAPVSRNEKENKHYVAILKDVYKNYKHYLNNSDTYFGFIDSVSKLVLPKSYYQTLSSRDSRKDEILRTLLTKTVMKFTMHIAQNELQNILDDKMRNDKQKVNDLKNKFIDIFTYERNEFSNLLMAKSSGVEIKHHENIPNIPKEISDKLQEKIKKLIDEKNDLIRERNNYAKYVNTLKQIIAEKDKIIKKLENAEPLPTISDVTENLIESASSSSEEYHKSSSRKSRLRKLKEQRKVETPNKSLEELKQKEYKPPEISDEELPDDDLSADE